MLSLINSRTFDTKIIEQTSFHNIIPDATLLGCRAIIAKITVTVLSSLNQLHNYMKKKMSFWRHLSLNHVFQMHIAVLDHLMALNEFVKLINIKSADQNMQSYEQQEKKF